MKKKKRILEHDTEDKDYGKVYGKNLKKFTKLESMIIRSHILTEHSLDMAITKTVLHGDKYQSDRFTFSHKLMIAEMFGLVSIYGESIRALNTLRNQISHTLSFDSKYVDKIINEKSSTMSNDVAGSKLSANMAFINGLMATSHKSARILIAKEVDALKKEMGFKK